MSNMKMTAIGKYMYMLPINIAINKKINTMWEIIAKAFKKRLESFDLVVCSLIRSQAHSREKCCFCKVFIF